LRMRRAGPNADLAAARLHARCSASALALAPVTVRSPVAAVHERAAEAAAPIVRGHQPALAGIVRVTGRPVRAVEASLVRVTAGRRWRAPLGEGRGPQA